jgi:hypothetical protein
MAADLLNDDQISQLKDAFIIFDTGTLNYKNDYIPYNFSVNGGL